MRLATASRKARSCEATRSARSRRTSACSSHSMAPTSRWLVGSSRRMRSGSLTTSRARAARVCSPPLSVGRWLLPLRRGRSPGRRAPRPRAGRGDSRPVPRTVRAAPRRRARPRPRAPAASMAASSTSMRSTSAAPERTADGWSAAAMKAASRFASWARRPMVRPRRGTTLPASGSSRPAASRRSVVLPAPLTPDQADPIALRDGGADVVEDDEGADLAPHRRETKDRTSTTTRSAAAAGPSRVPLAGRRVAGTRSRSACSRAPMTMRRIGRPQR